MRKVPIVIAGLYIYLEFLTIMLPFALSQMGGWLPDSVSAWFDSNYLTMEIGILIIPTILLLIMSISFALKGIRKSGEISAYEGLSLIKTQMIMRIIQIPCYVAVFIVATVCLFTIFTIGFTAVLAVVDCVSITITGIASIPVYVILHRSGWISQRQKVLYSILSFVFCADLVVSIICYKEARKYNSDDF